MKRRHEAFFTLEEDLAQMENEHGNWDDSSDEEDANLRHSVSRTTLASGASSNDLRASGDDSSNAVEIRDIKARILNRK